MNEPARQVPDDAGDRLALLRAGDADATRDALHDLVPHVRRWLFRLLGRSTDLDDATQDALAEIARFLPRFEGRSTLETAAHRITVRVAYRYFKTVNETSLEVVPELIDPACMESQILAREALTRLHRCLGRLPPRRRVAFVLCAIEGMTPSEASRIADTTALAMRCRLVHARREVARMLKGDPYLARWLDREEPR